MERHATRRCSIGNNYSGLFDVWEINDVKHIVKRFQKRFKVLLLESPDDLMQECLTHWFLNKNKHCHTKATHRTFLDRIVRNKLLDIVRKREAVIRKAFFESVSIESECNENMEAFLMIFDDEFDDSTRIELTALVSTALSKLTKRQQLLCNLLGEEGLSQVQVSRKLNISRASIQDEIKRIRNVFKEEGLEDFLRA